MSPLQIFLKRWWLILIFCIISTLTAYIFVKNLPSNFQASTKIFVSSVAGSTLADISSDAPYTDRAVKTVSVLLKDEIFFNMLSEETGYPVEEISKSISSNYLVSTQIIEIDAKKNNPDFVNNIVSIIPSVLEKDLQDIQKNIDDQNKIKISQIGDFIPAQKTSPYLWQLILLIFLLSLIISWLIVYLVEYFDESVKERSDIEKLGLNYLGDFNFLKKTKRGLPIILDQENSSAVELLREIRTNIDFLGSEKNIKIITITSANPKEGKSLFSSVISLMLAQSGKKVVLIDGDLRSPFLNQMFDLSSQKGLTEYLNGKVKEDEILIKSDYDNLWLVPAGHHAKNSSELLDNDKLKSFIKWLKDKTKADFIIFDTPPIGIITDAAIISGVTDGVIVVSEKGRTNKSDIKRLRSTFEKIDVKISGVVIGKGRDNKKYSYYYSQR